MNRNPTDLRNLEQPDCIPEPRQVQEIFRVLVSGITTLSSYCSPAACVEFQDNMSNQYVAEVAIVRKSGVG